MWRGVEYAETALPYMLWLTPGTVPTSKQKELPKEKKQRLEEEAEWVEDKHDHVHVLHALTLRLMCACSTSSTSDPATDPDLPPAPADPAPFAPDPVPPLPPPPDARLLALPDAPADPPWGPADPPPCPWIGRRCACSMRASLCHSARGSRRKMDRQLPSSCRPAPRAVSASVTGGTSSSTPSCGCSAPRSCLQVWEVGVERAGVGSRCGWWVQVVRECEEAK